MNGMRIQARQYVESTGADVWISAEGSGGAFIGFSMVVEEYMAFLNAGTRLSAGFRVSIGFRASASHRPW